MSLLGLTHVERNGHHFIDGFADRLDAEAEAYRAAHADLYERRDDRVRLRIKDGRIAMASLDCPGFGSSVVPHLETVEPMPKAKWPAA